jgi:glucan 1,3-beta-glucosidase
MDTHIYQMFSQSVSRLPQFPSAVLNHSVQGVAQSNAQHLQTACSSASELSSFDLWVIVGEWTPAMTDCAKYLNGRGVGSRYDGSFPGSTRVGSCTGLTGSASSFSSSFKTFLRQMWEAQVQTFEKGQGWIQWDWKNENADEWSYKASCLPDVYDRTEI